MKISIVTGIYPPDIGGPATFSKQMLNWLQSKHIESWVLTLKDKNLRNDLPSVIYIKRSKFLLFRILKSFRKILETIVNSQSICTGLYEEVGICIWINKKLFKSNNFYLARVVGDPVWERHCNNHLRSKERISEFKLGYKNKIQRKILVWSLNQFNLIVCPSNELKNLCESWGVKRKIEVVNNGLETRNDKFEHVKKKYDFITVSRIVSWKNLDLIIEICIEINASLLIVGDGPELKRMKEQYSDYKLIRFAGRCTEDEVRMQLAESRNYINASLYEGMSFSTLEAISTGMPIYVSDIPGNFQIINDFHLNRLEIVNRGQVFRMMSEAIFNQAQQDRDSAINIGIFKKLYSFESMASKYLKAMEKRS